MKLNVNICEHNSLILCLLTFPEPTFSRMKGYLRMNRLKISVYCLAEGYLFFVGGGASPM